MKSRLGVAMSILATLAAPAAIAAEHLRFVERASNEKIVSVTHGGDALGDLLVFSNPLFDAANRTQVGSSGGYCVRIVVGQWWQCQWTLKLETAALEVMGLYPDTGDAELAIVGGTGNYGGARGVLKLHARDNAHSAYDFAIELL